MSTDAKASQQKGIHCCLVSVSAIKPKQPVIVLQSDKVTVGRSQDVNVCLRSSVISRLHAILEKCTETNDSNNTWNIRDNDSLNGIFINNAQILAGVPVTLKDGDIIQFGVSIQKHVEAEFIYKFCKDRPVRVCTKRKRDHEADDTANKVFVRPSERPGAKGTPSKHRIVIDDHDDTVDTDMSGVESDVPTTSSVTRLKSSVNQNKPSKAVQKSDSAISLASSFVLRLSENCETNQQKKLKKPSTTSKPSTTVMAPSAKIPPVTISKVSTAVPSTTVATITTGQTWTVSSSTSTKVPSAATTSKIEIVQSTKVPTTTTDKTWTVTSTKVPIATTSKVETVPRTKVPTVTTSKTWTVTSTKSKVPKPSGSGSRLLPQPFISGSGRRTTTSESIESISLILSPSPKKVKASKSESAPSTATGTPAKVTEMKEILKKNENKLKEMADSLANERKLVEKREKELADMKKKQVDMAKKQEELMKKIKEKKETKKAKKMKKNEKKATKESNEKNSVISVMESELNCSICSEMFIRAVTLGCSHSYCEFCIGKWCKKKNDCPICRQVITSRTRSIAFDNFIESMVASNAQLKADRDKIIAERKAKEPPQPSSREMRSNTRSAAATYILPHSTVTAGASTSTAFLSAARAFQFRAAAPTSQYATPLITYDDYYDEGDVDDSDDDDDTDDEDGWNGWESSSCRFCGGTDHRPQNCPFLS